MERDMTKTHKSYRTHTHIHIWNLLLTSEVLVSIKGKEKGINILQREKIAPLMESFHCEYRWFSTWSLDQQPKRQLGMC